MSELTELDEHEESATRLTIEVVPHAQGRVVRVAGDVDFRNVSSLRDALTDALASDSPRVVVDLAGPAWIDSLGLGVLVAACKRARKADVGFDLWRPSAKARAILRMAQLETVLPILPDGPDDPFSAA